MAAKHKHLLFPGEHSSVQYGCIVVSSLGIDFIVS